jgi:Tfp pilus assembly protein FimT
LHQGWIIFNDTNGNNTRQAPGEELIRAVGALPGSDQQVFADNALANFIAYGPSGTVSSAGALVLCDKRGYAGFATAVIVSVTGSVRSGQADDAQYQPDIGSTTISSATSNCN